MSKEEWDPRFIPRAIINSLYELKKRAGNEEDMAESRMITAHEFGVNKLQDSCKVICKEFGFTSVSPLVINKLGAILRSKVDEYAHMTRLMMEHTGRTEAVIEDVLAAFKYKNISIENIREYAKHVKCERLKALPIFPVPDAKLEESSEAFYLAMYGPKPSERELAERPAHIPPYIRARHPEWIEEERLAKEQAEKDAKKTHEEREHEEFNRLKKISSYRRNENPEAVEQEVKDETDVSEYDTATEQSEDEDDVFRNSLLPNFMKMDFAAQGFFEDYERNKREEAERNEAALQAEKAQLAKEVAKANAPAESQPTFNSLINAAKLNTNFPSTSLTESSYSDNHSLIRAWCDKIPTYTAGNFPAGEKIDSVTGYPEDADPVFRMSDLVKPAKLKMGGVGSAGGSAPSSRPGSSMSTNTPEKRFGPGRPKKPKPETGTPPKPKGRPPKKATLEKRKLENDLMLAKLKAQEEAMKSDDKTQAPTQPQAQKPLEKVEKEKPEKKEKTKKTTLDASIRDQILRAKTQMLLPNSALAVAEPAPQLVAEVSQVIVETPEHDIPPVAITLDIETAPILFEEPAMEVEIKTDEFTSVGPSSTSSEIPLVNAPDAMKPKKEKRDKNSEEYKEYKRQKKEKRRLEREERKQKEEKDQSAISITEEAADSAVTKNPKLTLKIKLGSHYTLPQESSSPMRPDSTNSASRPASSRSNYHEDPPPPVNPPIKFRFKNFFNLTEEEPAKEDIVSSSTTAHGSGSRPGSSLLKETPSSSSASSSLKHHKKDKKDKEKKHKKEKERDREKEREREERKERERQQKEQKEQEEARREIEEKTRIEMEAKKAQEEEHRKEKERRKEEKRKEKERKREKEEKRERKEKEREREMEREREREREKERERIREKERERERKREEEKRKEEERKKKEKKKSSPLPQAYSPPVPEAPARPLITQEDDESGGTESSEEIWICPVCSVAYSNGANMVACDACEEWFHWHCVGLTEEPKDTQWFCNRCAKGNKKKKGGSKRSAGPHDSSTSAKRKKI